MNRPSSPFQLSPYLFFALAQSGLTLDSRGIQCQEPRVFFFANFGPNGNIRTFFKVWAILAVFNTVIPILAPAILWTVRHVADKGLRATFHEKFSHGSKIYFFSLPWGTLVFNLANGPYGMFIGAAWKSLYSWVAPSLSDHSVSFVNAVNIRTGLPSLGLSILPIELQVGWDNLEGVNCISRRGQVLALALGGFSLLRMIWMSFIHSLP